MTQHASAPISELTPEAAAALLQWYVESGIDTVECDTAADFASWPEGGFRVMPPPPPDAALVAVPSSQSSPGRTISADDAPLPTDEAVAQAKVAAASATSIEALAQAIGAFDGCALKPGARSTVVFDGMAGAPLLVIGEAPGKDEDRVGKPFVGRAGMLLDRMLAAIGYSRIGDDGLADACITNAIFWRPPGNRTPTQAEIAICQPFVTRFIELSAPKVILLAGNVPTQSIFPDAAGITRSRGQWRHLALPGGAEIPALPIFHPAFLLRQPAQKRLAWADLILVRAQLAKG